jgi:hypothetical protein
MRLDDYLPTPNPILAHVIDMMEREMTTLGTSLQEATEEMDPRAAERCIAQRSQLRCLIDTAKLFQEVSNLQEAV